MKALLITIITALALTLGACSPAQPTITQPTTYQQVQPTAAQQCEEDMPCWKCDTMGNKICGVDAPDSMRSTPKPKAKPATTAKAVAAPAAPSIDTINAQLAVESAQFAQSPYIPADNQQTVVYVSLTAYSRTDNNTLYSVQSIVDPTLWHTYSITPTPTQAPATDTIQQPTQAPAVAAPAQQPTAAPKTAAQPAPVAPAPKPQPKAVQPAPAPKPVTVYTPLPKPAKLTTATNGAGACMEEQARMVQYNEAHPENPATRDQREKFCPDWWK